MAKESITGILPILVYRQTDFTNYLSSRNIPPVLIDKFGSALINVDKQLELTEGERGQFEILQLDYQYWKMSDTQKIGLAKELIQGIDENFGSRNTTGILRIFDQWGKKGQEPGKEFQEQFDKILDEIKQELILAYRRSSRLLEAVKREAEQIQGRH